MKKTNTQTNKKQTNKKKKHSKNNFFVTGMKRIIPDSRYNSSFKKNPREKAKADMRKIPSQSSNKIRDTQVISEFSSLLKINKPREQVFFTVNSFYHNYC